MASKYWDFSVTAIRGCSHASRGCDNCWAEKMAWRLDHIKLRAKYYDGLIAKICEMPSKEISKSIRTPEGYIGVETVFNMAPRWTGKTRFEPLWHLALPRKPKRILFNAMGDLFHEANFPGDIQQVLETIGNYSHHKFIIPTKRPAIAAYHFRLRGKRMDNVFLLASVEDQESANERIPWAIQCAPFAHVGASAEPLLGPIDLIHIQLRNDVTAHLEWVICGSESGPCGRTNIGAGTQEIEKYCRVYEVPFFLKQWGHIPIAHSLQEIPKCLLS